MNLHQSDRELLDRPEILQFIFYPQKDNATTFFTDASTHFITVEEGITIGCRFHDKSPSFPTILYFHGNGETIGDYEYIAPLYNERGINLFVTDYRGYGVSNGKPTISSMIQDSHIIFHAVVQLIRDRCNNSTIFLMGRSLGSIPATELSFHYQDTVSGLIIESGPVNLYRLISRLKGQDAHTENNKKEHSSMEEIYSHIHIPTLSIHGEADSLIPVEIGKEFYKKVGTENKKMLIIPYADHNDLLAMGMERYFREIEEFVKTYDRHCDT